MSSARKYLDLVSTMDVSLAEHDARFHKPKYDPKTMTCEFRERRAALDPVDGDIDENVGISGIFTGSSADYSRPSLIHVGSGEGSQVYGWGLYGSNRLGVAKSYANLSLRGARAWEEGKHARAVEKIRKIQGFSDLDDKARNTIEDFAKSKGEHSGLSSFLRRMSQFDRKRKDYADFVDSHAKEFDEALSERPESRVYEQTFFTNRAKGDESHLLSWYDPVSKVNLERIVKALNADSSLNDEYSKTLLKNAKTAFFSNLSNRIGGKGIEEATGSDVYKSLSELYRTNRERGASKFLARADIDGIKYPVDSYGGKTIKDGDKAGWNYVSFRDDNIRVNRKFVNGEEVDVRDESPLLRIAREAMDESLEEHDEKYHPEGYHEGDTCNKRANQAKGDEADGLNPAGESRKDESGADAPNLDDLPDAPEPTKDQLEREYKYPKMSIMREINAMSDTRVKLDDGSDAFVEGAYFYDIAPGADGNSFSVSSNCGRPKSVDAICKAAEKGKMFKAWDVKKSGDNAAVLTKKDADSGDDDAAYLDAVKRGDTATCEKMVREAAERAGYSADVGYRISHHAPTNDGYNASLVDVEPMFGTSNRSDLLRMGYGRATAYDAVNAIMKAKGNPDAMIEVYRAVPKSVKDVNLRRGDWVSLSESYARQHGEAWLDGKYKIVKGKVPAKHLFTDGNMLEEAGFDDGQYRAYKNTKNGTKLLGVTYDDAGNVIPLSKRFDMRNPDIRY